MYKNSAVIIFAAIIFFSVGFFLGMFVERGGGDKAEQYFQEGWNAAKKRIEDNSPVLSERRTLAYPVKSLYGVITKIKNDRLFVNIRPVDPLADPGLDERIIIIGADTRIIQYVPKQDVVGAENGVGGQPEFDEEASLFEERIMLLSELKISDNIVVHSIDGIETEKEFVADEVVLFENRVY